MRRLKQPSTSSFRLIRGFSIDHNIARLKKYCDRLGRKVRAEPTMRRLRIKRRRQAQAAA